MKTQLVAIAMLGCVIALMAQTPAKFSGKAKLSGKKGAPADATALQWPPIGPDVAGALGPGNHVSDVPAKRCNDRLSIDHSFDGSPISITNATWTANKIKITFPGANTFSPTGIVTVAGVNPPGYNGTFGINIITSTDVTYVLNSDPGAYISGGTIQFTPQILAFDAALCYVTP